MTITVSDFRTNFSEFADVTVYPDPEVNFYLSLAYLLNDANRWGTTLDYGVQLFVAHNLAIEYDARRAGAAGRNPGAIVGTQTAGSVDKVSWSRDASAMMETGAGHWNLTTYGLRYIRLARMMGAGPVYVGAPSIQELMLSNVAWPGPYPYPNPSN